MKLSYFADTDSLYTDLSDEPSVQSREISEGVVLDYNAAGRLVGIDIDEASKRVQLDKLVLSQLPSTVETAAAQRLLKRREFDALCVPPVRALSARQIRAIRSRARMSQAVFAAVLNTSVSTVQKWEIGEKRPSGPSLKLLDVIDRKGIEALV